jgi:putative holliday junction resolvase
VGDSRIGVALSDPDGILASPLTIINRAAKMPSAEAIIAIATKNEVERIIVGLPLSMDGSISKQAEKVKSYVAELCPLSSIPVEYRDERLSTVTVKRMFHEVKKPDKDQRYDAMAAALILQGYLDEVKEMKERQSPDYYQPEN